MVKKIPLRRCVVSQQMFPKNEMLRIVKNKEGVVSVDTNGRAHGRGAYILKTMEILDKAIKSKALEKALETKIDEVVYDEIRALLK